jgi:hypothetical protein
MCRNCVRSADGKRLTNFPDPNDNPPIVIEPLPPMSKDMQELIDLWHRWEDEVNRRSVSGQVLSHS